MIPWETKYIQTNNKTHKSIFNSSKNMLSYYNLTKKTIKTIFLFFKIKRKNYLSYTYDVSFKVKTLGY